MEPAKALGLLETGGVVRIGAVHYNTAGEIDENIALSLARRVPTVSFTHSEHKPETIAEALGKRNIFVWNGHNYGLEPAKALGLLETGGVVRIGAVHYNTAGEIDETLNALEDIL